MAFKALLEADYIEQARIEYMDDCLYGIFRSLGADGNVLKPFSEMYSRLSGQVQEKLTGGDVINMTKAKLRRAIADAKRSEVSMDETV